MINKRHLLKGMFIKGMFFALSFASSNFAFAAEPTAYTPALFEAAKAAGKPILLEVTAPWCPTCKVQKSILTDLKADPAFKNLVALEIDFDSQKSLLRELKVLSQSTLIVYKKGAEAGRSTGDTSRESIKALIQSAI